MASRHAHTRPSRPVLPCMCSSSLDAVHPMAASDVACGHATPRRVYARESRSTPTLAPTPPPRRSSADVVFLAAVKFILNVARLWVVRLPERAETTAGAASPNRGVVSDDESIDEQT